jgi:hypothetical protein
VITRNWWAWSMDEFEKQVQRVARQMRYPSTPAIRWKRQQPQQRMRWTWALAALVLLVAVVMISPLRASVLEWLRIGIIGFYTEDEATPTPSMRSLIDLFGQTTLEEAQQNVRFTLKLPAEFGPPDFVYRQNGDGPAVIMVWQAKEGRPAISLYQFHSGTDRPIYGKLIDQATNTQVNGNRAAWVDMPHTLIYEHEGGIIRRQSSFLIQGNVLIWAEGDVTYRLESNLSMEEAVAIAESLREWNG